MFARRVGVVLVLAVTLGAPLHAQRDPHRAVSRETPDTTPRDSLPRGLRRITVAVATRDMVRGDTLRAADMMLRDTVIVWRWNGIAPDTTRPRAGWVTQRAMATGEVLRAPAVGPPPVVTSGATVSAIWQDGPVRLVLTGIATNSAALGAPVSVRIDRTRRLDGVAVALNTIRLR